MIDYSKRQTLTMFGAGVVASSLPAGLMAASTAKPIPATNTRMAYNGELNLPDVDFTVSTLGANSAITTITNHSKNVVTVTRLTPALIQHNNKSFEVNSAFGAKGITLKPGQKRMLIARGVAPLLA